MASSSPENDSLTRCYSGLLTHLYQYFGILLGCTGSGFPAYMGDPSMARVQKYMSLDPNEVGYFISQVGAAAVCLGVSTADAAAVGGVLQQYFGYRCSPPRTIGNLGPQLDSICENAACPLDPNANCKLYQQQGYAPYDAEPEPGTASQCMTGGGYSSSSSYYSSSSKYQSSTSKYSSKTSVYKSTSTPYKTTSSTYEERTSSSYA